MKRKKRIFANRRAVAAVEAAVCLLVIVLVWFASFELNRMLTLKQQAQLFATNAANQVMTTSRSFETIETDVEGLATSLGVSNCEVTVTRVNSQIVRSNVVIDFSSNSPLSSLLSGREVDSTFHSYRTE